MFIIVMVEGPKLEDILVLPTITNGKKETAFFKTSGEAFEVLEQVYDILPNELDYGGVEIWHVH